MIRCYFFFSEEALYIELLTKITDIMSKENLWWGVSPSSIITLILTIASLVFALVMGCINIEKNTAFNGLTGPREYNIEEIYYAALNAYGDEVKISTEGYRIFYKEPLRTKRYLDFSPSDLNAYFELRKDTKITFYLCSKWEKESATIFTDKKLADSILVLIEKEPDRFIER